GTGMLVFKKSDCSKTIFLPVQWCLPILLSVLILYSTGVQAIPGIQHDFDVAEETRNGLLRLDVEDMRVKVMGGYIRSTRSWVGGRWEFNRRWAPVSDESHAAHVQIGSVLLYRPGIQGDMAEALRSGLFRAASSYQPLPGSVAEENPVLYRTQ